jgi:hypothetical protein
MADRWVKRQRPRASGRCIGLGWLIGVGFAGCGADSSSERDPCAEIAQAFRECSLLSEGTTNCVVQDGDRSRADCVLGCLAAADCTTLRNLACTAQPDVTPEGLRLSQCATQCNEQFGFQCVAPGGGASAVDPGWVCDGEPDCADGSDEVGCEMFSCGDGQEVVAGALCDGFADCGNGRDEGMNCEQFTCANGVRVPESFHCDSALDCADGSDEADCGPMAVFQCPPEEPSSSPAPITCNPAAQTGCNDPAAPKCSVVPAAEGGRVTTCGPAGTVSEGQACTSTSPGVNDCAEGVCASAGQPDGQRVCLRYCAVDGDCPSDQSCLYAGGFEFGICAPTCTPFADCTAPSVCHALLFQIETTTEQPLPLLLCDAVGSAAPGSACTRDSDCRADSVCDPTLHCAQLCDPAHPCDALACTPIGNGISLCL